SAPPMTAVVCVLGCRPGSAAFARRVRTARDTFVARGATLLVTCGGRDWNGRVEADELARMLEDGGVPKSAILRERSSLDTNQNAIYAAKLLAERNLREVILVTCSWHLPRATRLFERAGLCVVQGVGAPPPNPTLLARAWWTARETVSSLKDALR
ncbi:MAG: putative rane protein, partial [Labilithrix sp.]|nr:putative rane protein [Labilithrix sp.]